MVAPDLLVLPDAEALARRGAEEFHALASATLARAPAFRVALAGGGTPRRLYEILAADYRTRVPWDRVGFFFGDERCLPLEHAESNFRMAREALLAPLAVPAQNIHAVDTSQAPAAAAHAYEAELARVFGVPAGGPPPAFDLILLGLGPDAHTASLFPGNPALREERAWVVHVRDSPKPPPDRVTLTAPTINAARAVVFLVADAGKADALASVLEGARAPERWPAQLVRPAGTLRWLADRAAAGKLAGASGR
jgi:6-phosphogluconolactonase